MSESSYPAGFREHLLHRAALGHDWLTEGGEAIAAAEVFAVIDALAASPSAGTRRRMAALHFFMFREVMPELLDWCDEQAIHERTAYRDLNRAVALVWKFIVARRRAAEGTRATAGASA